MDGFVPYRRKAQYYETDQMGIIHHSNYIRWFEEARIDFMAQAGLGYRLEEYSGVRMTVDYRVEDAATGELRCQGKTRHCFLDREGRPLSLKRNAPAFDQLFREAQQRTAEGEGA